MGRVQPPQDHIGPPEDFESDDRLIWRYMDGEKFNYLLSQSLLYFCRADLFEDQAEGYFPNLLSNQLVGIQLMEYAYLLRRQSYLSCWHQSDWESEAMWKVYGFQGNGVAIAVRVSSLAKQFCKCQKLETRNGFRPFSALCGKMFYIDDRPRLGTRITVPAEKLLFYKRSAFEHEKEFRMVIKPDRLDNDPEAFLLPVDLTTLIEQVVICPEAKPKWVNRIQLLASKKGLGHKVTKSLLDDVPDWHVVRAKCETDLAYMQALKAQYPEIFKLRPTQT